MKTKNLSAAILIVLIMIFTGCSKQDNKILNTNENQPAMQNDTSKKTANDLTQESSEPMKQEKGANVVHKMIKVPSVQCSSCKENLTKALNNVKGVKSFEIDIDNKIIHMNFDSSLTDLNKIENAITAAGYDADGKKANPEAYSKLDDCCKKPEDRKNK